MTKTPEELTEYKSYYCSIGKDELVKTLTAKRDEYGKMCLEDGFWLYDVDDVKILAPVPTYDEYKAMQEQIADASKMIEELKEKIKDKEELIQCLGSNIDELDVKKSVLIIENNKLRGLLKECVPYVTFKVNIEKNIGCTPSGAYLLIRIKDALGESEDDIERLYK